MINGHGDDIYKYGGIRLNFSSNIYNHFDHEDLFCHLAKKLDNVTNYPEPTPISLETDMAGMLDLTPEQVMVTNGATEGIYLIALTFRRAKSGILQPTFSEYADACRLHEHQTCNLFNIDEIPENAQMVWICNPNNPTGQVIDKEMLTECIAKHKETIFVIDASYAPFTTLPLLTAHEAAEMPNVLMLHSMTKEYSVPGIRLGYITGCENLLHQIRLQRMPWSVSQVAIDAGRYLLVHSDEYVIDTEKLIRERERVEAAMRAIGVIDVWPSDTHILLCKLRFGNAASLKDFLVREKGILIRDASNFAGLDSGFFRIAIQEPEENDELIKAITEWLAS